MVRENYFYVGKSNLGGIKMVGEGGPGKLERLLHLPLLHGNTDFRMLESVEAEMMKIRALPTYNCDLQKFLGREITYLDNLMWRVTVEQTKRPTGSKIQSSRVLIGCLAFLVNSQGAHSYPVGSSVVDIVAGVFPGVRGPAVLTAYASVWTVLNEGRGEECRQCSGSM